ncbi:unnamed protein product [Brassica rapa subsp. trilocularis]
MFFSLRHRKLSSPSIDFIIFLTPKTDFDASPPLFKCGFSGFRCSGELMGGDMIY